MKQFITPVIIAIAILAGSAGGHFLKRSQGAEKPEGAHKESDDAHGKSDEKAHAQDNSKSHGDTKKEDTKKKKTAAKGHGKEAGHEAVPSNASAYFKFSREFVVPLMEGDRVKSLVILNINLQHDESLAQTLFSLEPKLRDNIMTTLIALSNDGVTLESMTEVDNYETLRSTILLNLNSVVASGIENVLILDLAKQDV